MIIKFLAKKQQFIKNKTSCLWQKTTISHLWQNRLTAERNAQQNNLIFLSGLVAKGLNLKILEENINKFFRSKYH